MRTYESTAQSRGRCSTAVSSSIDWREALHAPFPPSPQKDASAAAKKSDPEAFATALPTSAQRTHTGWEFEWKGTVGVSDVFFPKVGVNKKGRRVADGP